MLRRSAALVAVVLGAAVLVGCSDDGGDAPASTETTVPTVAPTETVPPADPVADDPVSEDPVSDDPVSGDPVTDDIPEVSGRDPFEPVV